MTHANRRPISLKRVVKNTTKNARFDTQIDTRFWQSLTGSIQTGTSSFGSGKNSFSYFLSILLTRKKSDQIHGSRMAEIIGMACWLNYSVTFKTAIL
jgi:hypothetical protein